MAANCVSVCVCVLFACVRLISADGDGRFIFTVPKVLWAGRRENACLSFHGDNYRGRANVTITIHTSNLDKNPAITKRIINTDNPGCFDFKVPDTVNVLSYFHFQVRFIEGSNHSINSMNRIHIFKPRGVTVVQTDRDTYKPGDRVKIRILKLTQELGVPRNLVIPVVKIRNPMQIAIGQWENVTTELGLVQLEHQLSTDTAMGMWTIELPLSDSTFKTFEVKDYQLPRFEVIIIRPDKIYYKTDYLNFTVCAKYAYGEKLKGRAQLKLMLQDDKSTVHQMKELQDGCSNFIFDREEISIVRYRSFGIELAASVTESGTEQTETSSATVGILNEKYTLKLVTDQKYIQPGLPYRAQVRIVDNTESYANETLQVCYNLAISASWNLTQEECTDFRINDDNSVNFVILNLDDNVFSLHIKAKVLNDEQNNYYSLKSTVNRWYSGSNSYLQVSQVGENLVKCKSWQQYSIIYNLNNTSENETITFNYMVMSKNHIIKFGKSVQTPHTNDRLVNFRNVVGSKTTEPQCVKKFVLNVRIQPRMYPSSTLLVYYVRKDGEVIGNTLEIRVDTCLGNKVETGWSNHQKYPGETVSFKIKTTGNSLCAVSAVDKAGTFKKSSRLNLENLLQHTHEEKMFDEAIYACKSADTMTNVAESDFWDLRRKRFLGDYSASHDMRQVFKDFGVLLITDLQVISRPCVFHNYNPRMLVDNIYTSTAALYQVQVADKGISPRVHFPETWLWELIPINRNGEATIRRELPHSITKWVTDTTCVSATSGLGIARSTEIKAFQPFFIDVLMPTDVKKGEVLHVKVVVFNYLNHSLPVSITFHENKQSEFIGLPENRRIVSCIDRDDSVTTIFKVKAHQLGKLNLTFDAEVDSSYPGECGPEILLNRRDVIVKSISVKPEGYPNEEIKSSLVCAKKNDAYEKTKVQWNLEVSESIVKNSTHLRILLDADLVGLTAENLGNLLLIPNGCGEQIMSTLAPNLYVLRYLNATKTLGRDTYKKALKNMKIGYERILQYKHVDGSFSAFGDRSKEGSTFLTAFVIRTLSQCMKHVYIDRTVLEHAVAWLTGKQLENGCFPSTSHVFQPTIKDENEGSSALTAYVIISLIESDLEIPKTVLNNAEYCLRGYNTFNKYTLAITTYALSLLGKNVEVSKYLERLSELSVKNSSLTSWEEADSLSTSIEMTSYIIISLLRTNNSENTAKASQAIKWLMTQRNAQGGFVSTQDTVVALDALTQYASLVRPKDTNLTVSVMANGKEFLYRIRDKDKLKTKQLSMRTIPNTLRFKVHGNGCVLLQSILHYNTHRIISSEAFKLAVAVSPVSTIDRCSVSQISPCLSYATALTMNMAVLEVSMPSGYRADRTSLHQLVQNGPNGQSKVRRFEEKADKVVLYFTELNNEPTCLSFLINENAVVESRMSAVMHLYDYYNPTVSVFTSYEVPKCITQNITYPTITKAEDITRNDNTTSTQYQQDEYIINAADLYDTENIPTGLNPSFVDKDISLEYPDGIEGPKPVYVDPPANFTVGA